MQISRATQSNSLAAPKNYLKAIRLGIDTLKYLQNIFINIFTAKTSWSLRSHLSKISLTMKKIVLLLSDITTSIKSSQANTIFSNTFIPVLNMTFWRQGIRRNQTPSVCRNPFTRSVSVSTSIAPLILCTEASKTYLRMELILQFKASTPRFAPYLNRALYQF